MSHCIDMQKQLTYEHNCTYIHNNRVWKQVNEVVCTDFLHKFLKHWNDIREPVFVVSDFETSYLAGTCKWQNQDSVHSSGSFVAHAYCEYNVTCLHGLHTYNIYSVHNKTVGKVLPTLQPCQHWHHVLWKVLTCNYIPYRYTLIWCMHTMILPDVRNSTIPVASTKE